MRGMKETKTGWLRRIDRAVEAVERFVLSAGILLITTVSIANVIARNAFGQSITFAEEANQALIVLITFVGIGYGVRHARHIRMAAVYDALSGTPRKALMVITALGTGLLLLLLTGYAVAYVASVHALGSVTPALRIPLYIIYAVVPLGLGLGAFQYLLAAWRNLTTPGIHVSFQQREAYLPPGPEC